MLISLLYFQMLSEVQISTENDQELWWPVILLDGWLHSSLLSIHQFDWRRPGRRNNRLSIGNSFVLTRRLANARQLNSMGLGWCVQVLADIHRRDIQDQDAKDLWEGNSCWRLPRYSAEKCVARKLNYFPCLICHYHYFLVFSSVAVILIS